MTTPPSRPNLFHRTMQKIASSAPGAWLLSRTLHHLDRPVVRLTNGRASMTSLVAGLPLVTLTALGAKSGKPRSVPLIGIPVGEGLALIASNWGQERHPSWYYNVRAHPQVTVARNGRSRRYRARELDGAERAEVWETAVALYAGYNAYVRRAGDRQIPVFLLTPQEEEPAP